MEKMEAAENDLEIPKSTCEILDDSQNLEQVDTGIVTSDIEDACLTISENGTESSIDKVDPEICDIPVMENENKIDINVDELEITKQDIKNEVLVEISDELKEEISSPFKIQIESLEHQLSQNKADIFALETELSHTKERLTQENVNIRETLTNRLEKVMIDFQSANKCKEEMVIKYAMTEKEVLIAKRERFNFEKKCKEAERDKDILQSKVKSMLQERGRMCATLDSKISEAATSLREIERMKDEMNAKDVKIKWGLNRLRSEMDAHKETQGRLDKTLARISCHEKEMQAVRYESENNSRETKENENSRANTLDKLFQEHKALLIMERDKLRDTTAILNAAASELETLKKSHSILTVENETAKQKIGQLSLEREESEALFSSLQIELNNAKQREDSFRRKLADLDGIDDKILSERNKLDAAESLIENLQSQVDEQAIELSRCKEKENELLQFTQKLTDQDVSLQSELSRNSGKMKLLEIEHGEMFSELSDLRSERNNLVVRIKQLDKEKGEQESVLSSLLSEKSDQNEKLMTQVDDLKNEIRVNIKRHQNALKDSNRELRKLRKQVESFILQGDKIQSNTGDFEVIERCDSPSQTPSSNSHSSPLANPQDILSEDSRASSNTSLNRVEKGETLSNGMLEPALPIYDLPQHLLIDRIIKVQKLSHRRAEKVDFLEDHNEQLLEEIRKKNRILQYYILKQETGCLVDNKADLVKAELIHHGGIMASVYGSSPRDGALTLELSLEINKKLQAVLEDTLLKNITLKENLNTLGDEVAKLSLLSSTQNHRR